MFSVRLTAAWSVASLSLGVLLGCGPKEDPMKAIITDYKAQVEVPIQQEEALNKVFVATILDKLDPDQSVARIKSDVVPKAQQFHDAVKAIAPTDPTLKGLHDTLVASAQLQLEGYQLIVQGYESKDMNMFFQGKEKITNSKIQEETYVAAIEKEAGKYGMKVAWFSGAAQ